MSHVLVDTSVWVELFRGDDSPVVRRLIELSRDGLICTNGVVRAEVLSGARSEREYDELKTDFFALPFLEDPDDLWQVVGEARFRLARKGFQASLTDLIVAAAASHHRRPLLSLDRAFERIRGVLSFDLLAVPRHSA